MNIISYIYIITNIDNNPNKIYIGKTNNLYGRKKNHEKKYGYNINFDYIDEINSSNKKDWVPLECFWIEQFKQWGFELQNKNKGGGGPEFMSEETRLKMGRVKKGHICYKDKERNLKISNSLKGIKKPNSKGGKKNKGKKYNEEHCLNISLGKIGSKYPSKTEEQKLHYKYSHSYLNKIIIQYNTEGDFIKEWPSMKEAGNKLNINPGSISSCCLGNQKTYKNFIWKIK